MDPNEIEKRLREARSLEAARKNLGGPQGKLAVVAKTLGDDIIAHSAGGSFRDERSLQDRLGGDAFGDDYWDEGETPGGLPMLDDGTGINEPTGDGWREDRHYTTEAYSARRLGFAFDGPGHGVPLYIRFLSEQQEVRCEFRDHLVFLERQGQLQCYVPDPAWETYIDRFFDAATRRRKARTGDAVAVRVQEAPVHKQAFLDRIRQLWGG